jgi:hypothetical protein
MSNCAPLARIFPLVLVAIVVLGLVAIFVVRQRELSRPLSSRLPRDLTTEEHASLYRWQRRMQRLFTIVMISWALGFGVSLLESRGSIRGGCELVYSAILLLLITAVVVQFTGKCPACGYRLALQSRMNLPEFCERCETPLQERE